MKEKNHFFLLCKILLAVQLFGAFFGILDATGICLVAVQVRFFFQAVSMVSVVAVLACVSQIRKEKIAEEQQIRQDASRELGKARKREEELKALVEKQGKTIKNLQKASKKKQRGRNKKGSDCQQGANERTEKQKEAYPYKNVGENRSKFMTGNVEKNSDSKKVLIVDDSMTNLKLLSSFLKKLNVEACMAKSGKEALEAVQREQFALVLMDHMMKGKSGLETVKEIRQLKGNYYQNLPIVDVLSMGMEQYEITLNKEYYQAYLTKPIDFAMLQQVMIAYGIYEEE